MAINVKSFVLYSDVVEALRKLTTEQKGIILQAMFDWHNGIEPQIDDPVANAVFSIMEITFQRDAKKYATKCEHLRANASKRKQMEANATNCQQKDSIDSKSKQIGGDSDSDSVSDSVSLKNERKKNSPCMSPLGDSEFIPPALDEVKAYCDAGGLVIDPEEFWNYYEGNGWMNGGSPVKRWKNTAQTWNRKELTRRGMRASKKLEPKSDIFAGAI